MDGVLLGILGGVFVFVLIFFYFLFGKSLLRLFVELSLAVGLAYIFMITGVSEFMAYLALGLTVSLMFFMKAS